MLVDFVETCPSCKPHHDRISGRMQGCLCVERAELGEASKSYDSTCLAGDVAGVLVGRS